VNTLVLFVFAAVALFAYAVLSLVFTEDRVVSRRLKGMTEYESAEAREAQPVLKPFSERVLGPMADGVNHVVVALGPRNYLKGIREKLAVAGTPGDLSAEGYIAVKLAVGLVAGALVLVATTLDVLSPSTAVVAIPVALVLGYIAPNLWLRNVREHRETSIRRGLPDMLDMLTISVEAGLGFDAAVAKYVKNTDSPLAMEFGRVLQEVQAGAPRRDALRRMAQRTNVTDLNSFVAAMVQAEVLGTSVATVLRAQSHEMRLRRRQHAEEAAQKLPVKQVFPVVLCILPATLIVILGPAILALMRFFTG
jgi:tight adherence protein C